MASLNIPHFLKADLLLKALEANLNRKLEYISVKTSDDHTGNHIISATDFVIVKVRDNETKEEHTIQLFVKYASPDNQRNMLYEEAFDNPIREVLFFSKIFPELELFCKEEPMTNEKIQLTKYPLCYYANADKTIVLENLGIQGFKIHPPHIAQNEQHALWVLKYMAEFHAVSFRYLRKTQNRIVKENPMMNFQCFSSKVRSMFETGLTDVYKAGISVLNVPEHSKKFELVNKVTNNMFDKFNPLSDTEDRFNVICFGDCWSNNIFFKYDDEGNVVDLRFIDFQLAHMDTMFYDMHMYILSSTDHNLWESKMKYFLRHYFDSFNETLLKFKDGKPCGFTFEEFEDEFYRRLPASFMVVFQLIALRLLPQDEVTDPSGSSSGGGLMEEVVNYVRQAATLESTKVDFKNQVLAMYKLGERGFNLITD